MSRIGKKLISIPDGVKVAVAGRTVSVEGPKGTLSFTHRPEVAVAVNTAAKTVTVGRAHDDRLSRSLHGLTRSLIANMVEGCSKGYSRSLEVYGVGYSVQVQGKKFTLNCGYSHPVVFEIPAGLAVEVQTPQARGDNEPARFMVRGPLDPPRVTRHLGDEARESGEVQVPVELDDDRVLAVTRLDLVQWPRRAPPGRGR